MKSDVIFINGGNTYVLLEIFKVSGFDEKLREAYENGVILSGISSGLLCWFKEGITDSFGDLEIIPNCLNLLPFSCTPHYNNPGKKENV